MASYTMELRTVIDYYSREEVENWFKDYNIEDYLTADEIAVIQNTGIWSKDRLARKIIDHYFMREIGFETPALFKHYAKVTMQEIMEEKFPLIYSIAIKYDPLVNVDFTETFDRNASGNSSANGSSQGSSSSNSSSSSSSLGIDNQTPQTNITKQNLESGLYASSVGQNDSSAQAQDTTTTSNSQNSSGQSSSLEHYTRSQKGNSGVSATAQKMVEQFRDNIRAVDREIIEELDVLFFGIFN